MIDPSSNPGDVGYTVSTTDYFSARASRYEMSQAHIQFLDIPKLTTRDQQHSHLDIDGLLKRLISINPISLHQDVQARRLPGTGEWFIESAVFKQWVIPQAQQVLLCQGIPGAGKTTITSLVIDILEDRIHGTKSGMAYLYFDTQSWSDCSVSHAISSLLVQLLRRNGDRVSADLAARLTRLGDDDSGNPTLNTLLDLFEEAARLVQDSPIFVILDALDSLPLGVLSGLLECIRRLAGKVPNLKLFATSNWGLEHDFKDHFDSYLSLEIRAHDRDIRHYLQHKIRSLPSLGNRLDPELMDRIVNVGADAADGM